MTIRHRTFALLLVDGFSMMSLASAIEPLRSFNRLKGEEVLRWRLLGLDGAPVVASNGIAFDVVPASEALHDADIVFVCGGLRIKLKDERRYHAALRRAVRAGLAIGSLSTGAYLLARAGLLDGYRCTIHWENRLAFREEFPWLNCTDRIYEIDRNRFTCSGGTAAMDLMLRLVSDQDGASIARRVANQFHHDRIRGEEEQQLGCRADWQSNLPTTLRNAIQHMERQIEDPVEISAIADGVNIGARQLERLFKQHTGISPIRYYINMRISRAREMMLYSDRPVVEIAMITGFSSTSHFAHWFKKIHSVRPTELRRNLPANRKESHNYKTNL